MESIYHLSPWSPPTSDEPADSAGLTFAPDVIPSFLDTSTSITPRLRNSKLIGV
jgi:hypothetical protein